MKKRLLAALRPTSAIRSLSAFFLGCWVAACTDAVCRRLSLHCFSSWQSPMWSHCRHRHFTGGVNLELLVASVASSCTGHGTSLVEGQFMCVQTCLPMPIIAHNWCLWLLVLPIIAGIGGTSLVERELGVRPDPALAHLPEALQVMPG